MHRDESNHTTPNMVSAMSMASGLNVLLRAFNYAQDLRTDRWEFAVEVTTLNALGMTNTDLRWLERKAWFRPGWHALSLRRACHPDKSLFEPCRTERSGGAYYPGKEDGHVGRLSRAVGTSRESRPTGGAWLPGPSHQR